MLSIGGEDRLRKAFEQLDLLVCVDIYRNATGELADWVLPATDQFERDDLNIVNIGTSHRPFAQYTPAVVEPAGERRPEWWIVAALLQAMGRPSLLDDETPDPWAKWRHMLARRGHRPGRTWPTRSTSSSRRRPSRAVLRRAGAHRRRPRRLLPGRRSPTAIERCAAIFDSAAAEPAGRLKMITKRDQWMHNSWFSNLERMKRSGRTLNPLGINPVDAQARGLADGDDATLSNEWGEIDVVVRFDDDLLPGVVSLVHGWGHARSPGMRVAAARPGRQPQRPVARRAPAASSRCPARRT